MRDSLNNLQCQGRVFGSFGAWGRQTAHIPKTGRGRNLCLPCLRLSPYLFSMTWVSWVASLPDFVPNTRPQSMAPARWGSRGLPRCLLGPTGHRLAESPRFPWCGWLVSSADASLCRFPTAILGCSVGTGRGGRARDPESGVFASFQPGIPS